MSLIYKKVKGLKVVNNEDGTITLVKNDNDKYPINKVCKDIWNGINGVKSVNDIALDMSYKYNIPVSKITEDIDVLFQTFKTNGIIEEIW